jgi:hypothetical protein
MTFAPRGSARSFGTFGDESRSPLCPVPHVESRGSRLLCLAGRAGAPLQMSAVEVKVEDARLEPLAPTDPTASASTSTPHPSSPSSSHHHHILDLSEADAAAIALVAAEPSPRSSSSSSRSRSSGGSHSSSRCCQGCACWRALPRSLRLLMIQIVLVGLMMCVSILAFLFDKTTLGVVRRFMRCFAINE